MSLVPRAKPTCPLCKAEYTSYLYDIVNDVQFKVPTFTLSCSNPISARRTPTSDSDNYASFLLTVCAFQEDLAFDPAVLQAVHPHAAAPRHARRDARGPDAAVSEAEARTARTARGLSAGTKGGGGGGFERAARCTDRAPRAPRAIGAGKRAEQPKQPSPCVCYPSLPLSLPWPCFPSPH